MAKRKEAGIIKPASQTQEPEKVIKKEPEKPISEFEKCLLSVPKDAPIGSIKVPLSDIPFQDRVLNEMETRGFTHYETLNIGGNEIILRFRKREKTI